MESPRIYTHRYYSPVGPLHIAVNRSGEVLRIGLSDIREAEPAHPPLRRLLATAVIEENKFACGEVEYQLSEYFAGERRHFDLQLRLEGTEFQRAVWARLRRLEYGDTTTYGQLALKVGNRWAARAVGGAVARNPLPIIVPCHRVLPVGGGIGAYALQSLPDGSGRETKRFLLELEGADQVSPFT